MNTLIVKATIGLMAVELLANTTSVSAVPWTWSSLDYPGAVRTQAIGIDGNKIIGMYHNDDEVYHGFVFDGTTWATLDYPGAVETKAYGISESRVVGQYKDAAGHAHSFLFDGNAWSTLDYIDNRLYGTNGISGDKIFGYSAGSGFIYDGTTLTTLKYPGSEGTYVYDISGNKSVGIYYNSRGLGRDYHGFLYDGTTWTSLDYPGGGYWDQYNGDSHTYFYGSAFGISGDYVVGNFTGGGFLFNGITWTTLDYPGTFRGISGDNIVGYYPDNGTYRGFLLTLPEPATLTLLALGGLMLARRRCRCF